MAKYTCTSTCNPTQFIYNYTLQFLILGHVHMYRCTRLHCIVCSTALTFWNWRSPTYTCTSIDFWVNYSQTSSPFVTLGTEESAHCWEVAVMEGRGVIWHLIFLGVQKKKNAYFSVLSITQQLNRNREQQILVQIEFGDLLCTPFVSRFHFKCVLVAVAIVESWPL